MKPSKVKRFHNVRRCRWCRHYFLTITDWRLHRIGKPGEWRCMTPPELQRIGFSHAWFIPQP